MSVAKTVIETAPRREMALAFKYASEALNNSFFLDFLVCISPKLSVNKSHKHYLQKPPPPPPAENHDHELSPYLGAAIRQFLGSVDQLKSRVSATADGMASSGYVWLVTDQNGVLAVIPTYGAGTLLVRSRTQETPAEGLILGEGFKGIHTAEGPSNTVTTSSSSPSVTSPTSGTWRGIPPHEPSTPSRAFHTTHANHNSLFKNEPTSIYSMQSPFSTPPYSSRNENFDLSTLGETLYPLFCLSVHERSWLSAGYGIWGKEEWLKQFWTVLDWEKVSQAYVKFVPEPSIR